MRKELAQAKRKRALELWERGGPDMTTNMIAQRLGVSQGQVSSWLRDAGVSGEETRNRTAMLKAWGKGKTT